MDNSTYVKLFTAMGANIGMSNYNVSTTLTELESRATDLISANAEYFSGVTKVVPLVTSSVNSFNSSITSMNTALLNAINQFILNPVKEELASTKTTVPTVIDDLIVDMVAQNEVVLENGKFYTYFNANYGKELPMSTIATIDDSLAD